MSVDVQQTEKTWGFVFMYLSVSHSVAVKQFLVKFTFCRTIRFRVLPLRIWE